jgi:uncharacterized membrane protein YdbT with pleckstrin-like domain
VRDVFAGATPVVLAGWIIYAHAVILLLLAVALLPLAAIESSTRSTSNTWPFFHIAVALFLLFAIYYAFAAWFERWITEIAVTNQRVIVKRSFIRRETTEMNMEKVETVEVTQSILGRLLGYGSVHILGTGAGLENLHRIAAPLSLRNCITAR